MLKAPFRPQVAGRIAFFLGPIAGAIVSVISLRRMGHPLRAKRIFLWTLLAAAILSVVITVTPDILGRVIGLGSELAFYLIFPGLQDRGVHGVANRSPRLGTLKRMESAGMRFARDSNVLSSLFRSGYPDSDDFSVRFRSGHPDSADFSVRRAMSVMPLRCSGLASFVALDSGLVTGVASPAICLHL